MHMTAAELTNREIASNFDDFFLKIIAVYTIHQNCACKQEHSNLVKRSVYNATGFCSFHCTVCTDLH